jgi:hypothetical protein
MGIHIIKGLNLIKRILQRVNNKKKRVARQIKKGKQQEVKLRWLSKHLQLETTKIIKIIPIKR